MNFDEFSEAIDGVKELNIDKKHLVTIYQQLVSEQNVNSNDDDEKKDNEREIGIKFSDLLNALVYDYLISCDERLYDAFRKLDDDNDGKITTKQLKEKLKVLDPLGEWDNAMKIIEEQSFDQNGVIDVKLFAIL